MLSSWTLHAFHDQAALVWVLRCTAGLSRPPHRRFVRHESPAGDLTVLRQHWSPSLLSGMKKHQIDMEAQRRERKHQFGNLHPGKCPHCGTYTSLSRHVMSFHLDLSQLWQCTIPWCSVWKGTAQDCVDHLRQYVGSSVKASTGWASVFRPGR